MKTAVCLFASAMLALAAMESAGGVTRASLTTIEKSLDDKLRTPGPDPYDLLGFTRGTYLEGYGVIFTFEVNLIYSTGPNPFRPAMSREEIASLRDRKFRKLLVLKDTMRRAMVSAAALPGLGPADRVACEAFLIYDRWENHAGMPHRILMTAGKSRLQEAAAKNADLASVIQEQQQ